MVQLDGEASALTVQLMSDVKKPEPEKVTFAPCSSEYVDSVMTGTASV
jgi:hypothetical protein